MSGREIKLPIDMMYGVVNEINVPNCPIEYVQRIRYSMTNAFEKVRKAVKVTAVRQSNLIIIMLNLVVEVTVYGCTPMPSDKHKFGRVTDG